MGDLDLRSPLAKARDEWLASPDGKACSDPKTLQAPEHQRQYLENRLVSAFLAGAKSVSDHIDASQRLTKS